MMNIGLLSPSSSGGECFSPQSKCRNSIRNRSSLRIYRRTFYETLGLFPMILHVEDRCRLETVKTTAFAYFDHSPAISSPALSLYGQDEVVTITRCLIGRFRFLLRCWFLSGDLFLGQRNWRAHNSTLPGSSSTPLDHLVTGGGRGLRDVVQSHYCLSAYSF